MSPDATRVKRWISQCANHPSAKATKRMMAVTMMNSVLFMSFSVLRAAPSRVAVGAGLRPDAFKLGIDTTTGGLVHALRRPPGSPARRRSSSVGVVGGFVRASRSVRRRHRRSDRLSSVASPSAASASSVTSASPASPAWRRHRLAHRSRRLRAAARDGSAGTSASVSAISLGLGAVRRRPAPAPISRNSIRRLASRPSSVSLSAIGFSSP